MGAPIAGATVVAPVTTSLVAMASSSGLRHQVEGVDFVRLDTNGC